MCSEPVELDFEILDAETTLPIDGMVAQATAIELNDGYMKVSGLSVHGNFHQHDTPREAWAHVGITTLNCLTFVVVLSFFSCHSVQ